jgi:hypothetical protein
MRREQGLPSPEELANDIANLDYAAREGIPFDLVYKGFDRETISSLEVVDGYFGNQEEQFYHGIVTGCFAVAPSESTDEEARKLINYFLYWRQNMVKGLKNLEDDDSIEALEIVGRLSLGGILEFAPYCAALNIDKKHDVNPDSADYKVFEDNARYWSRIEEIAERAVNIYNLFQDPDFDLDLDLDPDPDPVI